MMIFRESIELPPWAVLDALDVGLHLAQYWVERAIAETLDIGLHQTGNVWLHIV